VSADPATVGEVPTAAEHLTAFLDATPLSGRVLAGEPPARFRRRLLLERAAYLALTTDLTLLEIAHGSGFTGQATFATAFRQELGALPSAWRAEPTSYVVDAPGDVHFHPPDGLHLPARHRMDGMDLVVAMVEQHVRLLGELVDRAHLVSDDDLDRADLREPLTTLVGQLEALNAAVHPDADIDAPAPYASVPALRRRLDRAGPAFVDDVARLAAAGRFDEAVVDAFSPDPQVRSYGAMVADVLTVGSHLRLLAVARLRELGVAGDSESRPASRQPPT
jgi:hypothetical protein